ncbi:MAG: Imm49 family immunity protein [Pedobacter sp.]
MELGEQIGCLATDIAFWMIWLTDPECPVNEMGGLSLEVSEKLRTAAIILLISHSSSDGFYHNLIRSGRARLTYLERLKKENIADDHHQVSGRYDALLDVIAADDFESARRIAELSPHTWMKGHEYEDDYCYAQILHRLVQEPPPIDQFQPLLTQFETYLDGEPNTRFEVCKTLVNRDQAAFDEAFNALIEEQETSIQANRERGQRETPAVIANRQVFVEGLAILRLAEKQGLKTESEYRYCPSLAKVPMVLPFPGE